MNNKLEINIENFEEIKDAKNVNCIMTAMNNDGIFLCACTTDGESIMLTNPTTIEEYSSFPIRDFWAFAGDHYMEEFETLSEHACVNAENLKDFSYISDNRYKAVTQIVANFKNGSAQIVYGVNNKKLKSEQEKLNKILNTEESFM